MQVSFSFFILRIICFLSYHLCKDLVEELSHSLQLVQDISPTDARQNEINHLDQLYKDLKELKRRPGHDKKAFVSRLELLTNMVSFTSSLPFITFLFRVVRYQLPKCSLSIYDESRTASNMVMLAYARPWPPTP